MAHVIVTRPEQQAVGWLRVLARMGHEALSMPLIDISPVNSPDDAAALQAAWQQMGGYDALMFVSSSAAQAFFRYIKPQAHEKQAPSAIELVAHFYQELRLWATGQGTVTSLRNLGIAAERIDAPDANAGQFDSEALWEVVKPQIRPGKRVLILRGRDVGTIDSSRDWLAEQIIASGGVAKALVVYQRRAPLWSQAQVEECQRRLVDGSIWLLSSSQAIRNLPPHLDASRAVCVCTHERIARTAYQRGFAVVQTSRPTLQDVAASIKSLDASRSI